FAGEDPEAILMSRLYAMGGHLDNDSRHSIAENLVIEPLIGQRLNVMDVAQMNRVIEMSAGARLIVFDTLSRIHELDENSNSHMAVLVSRLEYIATHTGAAVLYLHHVNKGAARDGQADQQQAARGASALIDNARWCGYVAKMSEDESERLTTRIDGAPIGDNRGSFVRFGVSKNNYGKTPDDIWYERRDGGVLRPVEMRKISDKNTKNKGGKSSDFAK
ncbi:helicase RepA family protein, partial [Aeromonas caviae]